MSYDIRLAVKVEGAEDCYAVIAEPEYHSPTYNLGTMFRRAMGFDFKQGTWYRVDEILPFIERGIHELQFNKKKYTQYVPENGWGTMDGALKALESLRECISHEVNGDWSWNKIPIECLYVSW